MAISKAKAAALTGAPPEPEVPVTPEPEAAVEPVEAVTETCPEGHVSVRVRLGISGLRNGESWPAPGELIVLPEDEAAAYLVAGIVTSE